MFMNSDSCEKYESKICIKKKGYDFLIVVLIHNVSMAICMVMRKLHHPLMIEDGELVGKCIGSGSPIYSQLFVKPIFNLISNTLVQMKAMDALSNNQRCNRAVI